MVQNYFYRYNNKIWEGSTLNQEALPQTYTVKQVAEILRVHVNTIRNQIRKENIKAVKVGKHYLILEDEVDRLLEEGWKGSRSWKGPQSEGPEPEE